MWQHVLFVSVSHTDRMVRTAVVFLALVALCLYFCNGKAGKRQHGKGDKRQHGKEEGSLYVHILSDAAKNPNKKMS